jgi:HSP20 family protein
MAGTSNLKVERINPYQRYMKHIEELINFDEIRRVMDDFMKRALGSGLGELRSDEPIVFGVNMRVGPDGKPVIQKFGNVRPTMKGPMVSDKREPLVDVIEREGDITVFVELPGVNKSQINLKTTDRTLTISAPGEESDFYKEVKLPSAVDSKSAKANYKNGVLEVCLQKREKSKPKAESIPIE